MVSKGTEAAGLHAQGVWGLDEGAVLARVRASRACVDRPGSDGCVVAAAVPPGLDLALQPAGLEAGMLLLLLLLRQWRRRTGLSVPAAARAAAHWRAPPTACPHSNDCALRESKAHPDAGALVLVAQRHFANLMA